MDDEEPLNFLTTQAKELWDRELRDPTATGLDSYGARDALENFVDRAKKGAFTTSDLRDQDLLIAVVRLIERVLSVDLTKLANRKGAVPAALGLVDRAKFANNLRDRVIYRLTDLARFQTGVAGRNLDQCCDFVVQAFDRAGIASDLSPENVKKIYQRISTTESAV